MYFKRSIMLEKIILNIQLLLYKTFKEELDNSIYILTKKQILIYLMDLALNEFKDPICFRGLDIKFIYIFKIS